IAIEDFRRSTLPSAELYRELRAIKGIGEYAASGLLKLLGRYDRLGLDSWCRMKFAEIHNGGTPVSDAAIEAYYAPFEQWKGLVMWMDVTRHWYAEKFPF
ncbi:MAG: 3-methyladenine DNA glycosylase, partial [Bacteroidota bacterium]|nr:3-methyladenine DNA glycosylase [Bacteroidota bacterium]